MASNIYLYNIPGISRADEPMFSTKEMRDLYFSTKSPWSPTDGFFVPHFKDALEFDTSDLSFNSNCNYVRISFLNRDYFYFIDRVEYVSEDVIRIYITMDVIQTYAYDLEFYKYERTRKLIARWVNNKINRNYIRENPSNGLMQLHHNKVYSAYSDFSNPPVKIAESSEDGISGIIVQVRTNYTDFDTDVIANVHGDTIQRKEYGSYVFTFLPLLNHELQLNSQRMYAWPINDPDNPFYLNMTPYSGWKDNYRDAEVVNAYYLPLNPVFNFSYTHGSYYFDMSHMTVGDNMLFISNVRGDQSVPAQIELVPYTDVVSFGFVEANSHTEYFNCLSVPAMLDENFMRISFGEGNFQATYPLYNSNEDEFTCTYIGNPFSGARYYRVTAPSYQTAGVKLFEDKFLTSVCANNPLNLDIIADSWRNYWAYNKASLLTALGTTAIRAFTTFGVGSAVNSINSYANSSLFRLNAGDPDAQTRILIGSDRERNTRSAYDVGRVTSDITSVSSVVGSALNACFAPDSPKSMGTYWTDMITGTAIMSCSWYVVNDFDECARYFETNGYKVHEINKNTSQSVVLNTPSPWLRTRYYYDVVSIDNIAYRLVNAPLSQEADEELRSRFANGFRAWHGYTYLGRTYLYIEARNLILGSTCIYDNTEVS